MKNSEYIFNIRMCGKIGGNELMLLLPQAEMSLRSCFCMSFSCSAAFNGNSAILQLCVLHNRKIASASAASRFLDFSAPSDMKNILKVDDWILYNTLEKDEI